jgi:hypothetical protein
MTHDEPRGRVSALWAAVLGTSVAACGGVVPIGNGSGDGGGGAPGSASIAAEEDSPGGPAYTGEDAASSAEPDAGAISEVPDAGVVVGSLDSGYAEDASTVLADAAGQCPSILSSANYAEDPPVCDACMAQSCCAQNEACGTNTDCVALITCAAFCEMDGGTNTSCESQCIQEHGAGGSAYLALMQCMDTSCDLQACFPLF